MSKDDVCKVTSASKHKERKPKKPHYIPRPWGKPYNYKCFQCPFTCMEKSHLYNHMKYSLCKNSLSLLIESDWPYKKGNILHPEQLRPYQQAHNLRPAGKDGPEQVTGTEERQKQQRAVEEEEGEDRESQRMMDDEEGRGRGDRAQVTGLTKESLGNKSESAENAAKKTKQPESERLMADMLSLEDQLLRARSVEVEAQLKHYKLSKTCLTAPGLLSEQWRLFTSSQSKAKAEGAQPRVGASIPCYPPPPNLVDYPDPTALNLSMLGVGYPISPSLFSYVNSAIPTAAAAAAVGVTAQTHAQLAQLPLLASAAQLMPPVSSTHADRGLIPPRLYYPFMCEHTFGAVSGQSDASKVPKTSPNGLEADLLSGFHPKVSLWKVPALRPGAAAASPAGWVSPQRDSPDQGYRLEDKQLVAAKDGKAGWGLKRTVAPLGNHEAPAEKKAAVGLPLDLLKNIRTASSFNMAADKLLHGSLQDAQLQTHPRELWYDSLASPNSETSSLSACGGAASQEHAAPKAGEGASESVAALLSDLSKALQEYQEAERKISHMEKEDLPAQCRLWEHLGKIRSELSHIHQALERTSRHSDGPLDLSVKKVPSDLAGDHGTAEGGGLRDNNAETEEEEEEDEELEDKRQEEEEEEEEEEENERRMMKASLESRKQSLDMLIKMSQTAVVNTEVLSPGGLGVRPTSAEALWPNRTTKCEADSSVLLCPDGRSVVFTDIPPPAKTPKRPPSIQRLEAQCPPSPLAATDN